MGHAEKCGEESDSKDSCYLEEGRQMSLLDTVVYTCEMDVEVSEKDAGVPLVTLASTAHPVPGQMPNPLVEYRSHCDFCAQTNTKHVNNMILLLLLEVLCAVRAT
jgi:hypothetical protein